MPTPPAESSRDWDCRTPSGGVCLGIPFALPLHPDTEEMQVPAHLPPCRPDFLSVLACSRRRCFAARPSLTSVFHDAVMRRAASLGKIYGVFGDDRQDVAMDALTALMGKVHRVDSWDPDLRDAEWHRRREQGEIESFAPLISASVTGALRDALRPYVARRKHTASLYQMDEDGEEYLAVEEEAGADLLGDPQEFVVDDLQFTLLSEQGQATVRRFLLDLHEWLADYPDDVQKMLWLYLRNWGAGGSRRSAAVAIFGETPSGMPVLGTQNNKIMAALEEYLRNGLAQLRKDETTRPVALLLTHALQLDINAQSGRTADPDPELQH